MPRQYMLNKLDKLRFCDASSLLLEMGLLYFQIKAVTRYRPIPVLLSQIVVACLNTMGWRPFGFTQTSTHCDDTHWPDRWSRTSISWTRLSNFLKCRSIRSQRSLSWPMRPCGEDREWDWLVWSEVVSCLTSGSFPIAVGASDSVISSGNGFFQPLATWWWWSKPKMLKDNVDQMAEVTKALERLVPAEKNERSVGLSTISDHDWKQSSR